MFRELNKHVNNMGTAVAQWLRCCATNRKVAGSIQAGVSGFFIDIILPITLWPWGRLSLQQKWVPGAFPGGKGGRCVRLTTYHHPVPLSRNLGALTSWNPLGLSKPVMVRTALPFYVNNRHMRYAFKLAVVHPGWILKPLNSVNTVHLHFSYWTCNKQHDFLTLHSHFANLSTPCFLWGTSWIL